MDKRTRIRRAAQYAIADCVETSLNTGEDFTFEADYFGITIEELETEMKRQIEIMFQRGMKK